MDRRTLLPIATLACGLCFFGGYRLRVFADGAPENPSLFYSGTLEQDGERVNGDYTVTLSLFSAAKGGEEYCSVESEAKVENGAFRIDATGCEGAVRDNANTWIEVSFTGDDGIERTIEGRSKLGAVPYALETDRAIHADRADSAGGALQATLQELTERIQALEAGAGSGSAFQAVKTTAQSIPANARTYVTFNDVTYDVADEYDPDTGTFTPKQDGTYAFSCIIAWDSSAGVVAQWEASLNFEDQEIFYTGDISDGQAATRTVYGTMKLAAGDRVRCAAYQEASGAQPLNVNWAYTTFEGHRIGR